IEDLATLIGHESQEIVAALAEGLAEVVSVVGVSQYVRQRTVVTVGFMAGEAVRWFFPGSLGDAGGCGEDATGSEVGVLKRIRKIEADVGDFAEKRRYGPAIALLFEDGAGKALDLDDDDIFDL